MAVRETDGSTVKTSAVLIAAAWMVVILPAAWGLEHTVENALKIFAKPVSAGDAPPPVSAPASTTPAK